MTTRNAEQMADLKNFANAVLAKAAQVAEGPYRLGRKVFVAALEPSKVTKSLLLEAHQAGLLRLSRCDLAPAFDREIQRASEIRHPLGAIFHFLTVG
jgi:hypothetical protein